MQNSVESKSDIAHLCHQIELECISMRLALSGYAAVAKHDIIAHRHAMLSSYHEQLAYLVGRKAALEISIDIYDQTIQPGQSEAAT